MIIESQEDVTRALHPPRGRNRTHRADRRVGGGRGLPAERGLAQAIISLGHALNLKVIAEGVETDAQLRFLVKHHCDEVQGFYYGEPATPDAIGKLLARGRSRKKRG